MSEVSFEELLKEEGVVSISNGQIVEGTVIDVKEDEIVLNIGYKADGIISRKEYSNAADIDLRTAVKVGDVLPAKVVKVNDGEGQVILTYKKLAAEKANKRLEEAFNNKEVLKAVVTKVSDKGLVVDFGGAAIFIPASLVSDIYERDLSKYDKQEVEFVIIEYNPKKGRIIGDRKQLVAAKKKAAQEALFAKLEVGMTVEGVVKNVTSFGAFVDLGGVDGLLHISEMSWGRLDNPGEVVKVGDKVNVLVKDIKGEKIALSMKFEDKNPWLTVAEKYAKGTVITGKVARMAAFGAFVELEPGVDALLHVSQISKERVEKPENVLSIGQEITAKVVDVNAEAKKISLSIRALEEETKDDEEAAASDEEQADQE